MDAGEMAVFLYICLLHTARKSDVQLKKKMCERHKLYLCSYNNSGDWRSCNYIIVVMID